jgi:hypothetical protein
MIFNIGKHGGILLLVYTYFFLHFFSSLFHGGAFVEGGVSGADFKLETRVKGLWLIAQGRMESIHS